MNTEEIIEGYMGDTIVNSIYQGSELIWPKLNYKYMIGGAFTGYNFTTPKNKIIRLNDDGSIDNTWYNNNSYTSGTFYKLIYDNINKKIYGAGSTVLDGGLVRFNLDGTKDTSFNTGTGFNTDVYSINIDTINQKIYVGGGFTTYNGSTRNRLIRLNMDGSLDTNFNIGTGFNDYSYVYDIDIDNVNSKIYVGGTFTNFQGSVQKRLARLNMDGSLDTNFNIGTGFENTVEVLNIDTINQKIYVGGNFIKYNDNTQNRLVRLNLDGTKDTSFDVGTGFSAAVSSMLIDTINQKIYVGGDFSRYNGSTQNRLVRLNLDGTKDTSFDVGAGPDRTLSGRYCGILIDNEKNKIYIAGNFTTYNNISANKIARLNYDGSLDNTYNIQLNSDVYTIIKYIE